MCGIERCLVCTVRSLLWALNGLAFVIALSLVFVSGYLLSEFHNTEDLSFVERDVTIGLLVLGVAILSMALFGCVGSVGEMACALRIYAIILLLMIGMEAFLTATILQYTGQIEGDGLTGDIQEAVQCAWKICCRGYKDTHCDFDKSICDDLPHVFTSKEHCALYVDKYEEVIADWAQQILEPALVVLWIVLSVQCGALLATCCLCGSRTVLQREFIVVVQDHENGANDYARMVDNRVVREERSRYRHLRSFFSRKSRRHSRSEADLLQASQGESGATQSTHGNQNDGQEYIPVAQEYHTQTTQSHNNAAPK